MKSFTSKSALRGLRSPSVGTRLSSRALSCTAQRHMAQERQWSTPLARKLADAVTTTGPIPLSSYMRMCLTGDLGGYYTGAIEKDRDQFGRKGDFVTSPEISQMFGELLGIWIVGEWFNQGKPKSGVQLIEVGPGRGTLMDDMLRTIRHFREMADSIDAVHLVEASHELRVAQKNLLCGEDARLTESKCGYHSTCKTTHIPIVWTETIKSIPKAHNTTPFIIAHEFFDALPIHAFQTVLPPHPDKPSPSTSSPSTEDEALPKLQNQWRELVVSPTPPNSTHSSLRTPTSQSHSTPVPDFQLSLSPDATRHSLYLPESSARYRALRRLPAPATAEICPDAALYAADFAARIGGSPQHPKTRPSGAALIVDYGPGDGSVPTNTLRGIRQHQIVSPFAEPGLTDLSADVDFTAIAEAACNASRGVEVHGPVEQGDFLEIMGIRERAAVLMKGVSQEKAQEIERAMKRLTDRGPNGMGKIYKALTIVPENDGMRAPVGFGGDIKV